MATWNSTAAVNAIPASWYCSNAMFELERRAIFSRKWLLVSHKARYVNSGDYVRISVAGFSFFLIRSRQGEIYAHHNVCRHRASPLVHEGSGKLSVLACRYHGWSYGFDGKLAKAPNFQEDGSFDKSANGLFKIHTHIDRLGYIWVNFDSQDEPEVPWEESLAPFDIQPRLQHFNLNDYTFDHQWEMLGDFNWKTFADNYNECYHCSTAHSALSSIDFSAYFVKTVGDSIQHFPIAEERINESDETAVCTTFCYPFSATTVSRAMVYVIRCLPVSATQCKMEFEVYRHKGVVDDVFHGINGFIKSIFVEDRDLCAAVQKNLNAGIFTTGNLHHRVEQGVRYSQQLTRKLVMDHRKREEAAGREISPAVPQHKGSDSTQEEIDFCNRLDCKSADIAKDLAW